MLLMDEYHTLHTENSRYGLELEDFLAVSGASDVG